MILKNQIITNIIIENVNDLYKLKPFLEDGTLRINKTDIQNQKQGTVMIVLHLFMTLLQSCYQIKISRYSTTEKYYGNYSQRS